VISSLIVHLHRWNGSHVHNPQSLSSHRRVTTFSDTNRYWASWLWLGFHCIQQYVCIKMMFIIITKSYCICIWQQSPIVLGIQWKSPIVFGIWTFRCWVSFSATVSTILYVTHSCMYHQYSVHALGFRFLGWCPCEWPLISGQWWTWKRLLMRSRKMEWHKVAAEMSFSCCHV